MLNKLKIDTRLLKEMDWTILITAICILLFGVLNIYISAGAYYAKLQLLWLCVGLVAVYASILVDYTVVKNYVVIFLLSAMFK